MKDKSSIYFIVFALFNTLVGCLVLVLNISILSTEDYGIFVLYGTYLSYLTITCFGIQDGMKLRMRKKKLIDIKFKSFIFKIRVIYLVQIISAVILLLIFNSFTGFIMLLSFPFNNIILVYMQIYLSIDKLPLYNVADFLLKLFQIISILIVLITGTGILALLILNLLYRIVIVTCLSIYNNMYIYKNMDYLENISSKNRVGELIEDTRIGFIVTLASWVFNFCFCLDVLVLKSNVTSLGIYSQSKSIALLPMALLVPLSSLIFAKFSSSSTNKEMEISVRRLFSVAVIFVFIYLFLYKIYGYIDMDLLNLVFSETTLLIILIFPFTGVVTIYLKNVLMILNVKKFLFSALFILLIFIVSYQFFSFTGDVLYQVLFGNILAYFCSMFFLCIIVIGCKRSFTILIDMIVYFLIFALSIVSLLAVVLGICYFARKEINIIIQYARRFIL